MRNQIGLGAILSALLLTLLPVTASATPQSSQGQGDEHRSARAQHALEQARGLFQTRGRAAAQDDRRARRTPSAAPDTAPADPSTAAPAEHATLVLRDLALSLPDLAPDDRRLARRILARPTDGAKDVWKNGYPDGAPTKHSCAEYAPICVHWVTDKSYGDAPNLEGRDAEGVPAWVRENREVFEEVWERIVVLLGYRSPLPDEAAANHGPDGRTDIYLADIGKYGMYGYCTMDDAADQAAYCVIDNDFAEFPADPDKSLRVTAAHEFFHAVQFAYNIDADYWLMEGTAAWIEDEVYDDINDNLQYLSRSALTCPGVSLDFIGPSWQEIDPASECPPGESLNWVYSSWVWWRFLTEYFATDGRPDPSVVKQVWQRVGGLNGPKQGTLKAQESVLAAREADFASVFARFGVVNRIPHRWYDEGGSYRKFGSRTVGRFNLNKDRRDIGWKATRLHHLSNRHAVIRPGDDLTGPWRLRLNLDVPARLRGGGANLTVHWRDGRVRWREVRLDPQGKGRVALPFDARRIARVVLTMTNSSTRMVRCGEDSPFTCRGWSRDDDLRFAFRARAIRR